VSILPEYVISSISTPRKYIKYDNCGKMTISTNQGNAAKFQDAAKAWRVLTSQISKKKRDGWQITEFTNVKKQKEPDRIKVDLQTPQYLDEGFDWNTVKDDIKNSFSKIISYKERLNTSLSRVEEELCDCEHACEFFKCDAAKGYKLYSMIRERRIERRFLKNELWKANAVLGMSYSDIVNGQLESAFAEIEQQSYEPRILKELFEDVCS